MVERWRGERWRGERWRGGEARGREYKERAFGGESLCNKLPSFHMPPRDTTKDEKAVSPTSNTVELEITIPEGSNPGDILSVEVNGEMLEAPWASTRKRMCRNHLEIGLLFHSHYKRLLVVASFSGELLPPFSYIFHLVAD